LKIYYKMSLFDTFFIYTNDVGYTWHIILTVWC